MSLERHLATFMVDHRRIVLAILAVLTVVFGYFLKDFGISHNPREQLPEDDPEIRALEEFEETFGKTEIVVATIEAPDIFTPGVLTFLKDFTEELENLEGTAQAISLANMSEIAAEGGMLSAEPVLKEIPETAEKSEALRKEVLNNKRWVGNVISADGTVAAVNLFTDESIESTGERREYVEKIEALAKDAPDDVRIRVTGFSGIIKDAIFYLKRDIKRFLVATALVMFLLLVIIFRSVTGVAVPLILMFGAVTWTLGIFFMSGESLDLASALMPTLIVLICLSDAVHTLVHYRELAHRISDHRELVIQTMEHMIAACFLTSVTTAVGIGSLSASQIATVRQFGIWSAVGILLAYVLVVTLLPALLMIFPHPRGRKTLASAAEPKSTPFLAGVGNFALRDRVIIPVTTVAILVAAVFLIRQIRIETELATYLPKNAPSVQGLRVVDEKLAGVGNLQITIRDGEDVLKKPWALREIAEIQEFIEQQPGVMQVISPALIVKELNRLLSEDQPGEYAIPDDEATIEEYFFILNASEWADRLNAFMTGDYSTGRISIQLKTMTTAEHLELLDRVEAFAAENLDDRLSIKTTGRAKLFAQQTKELVQGQMRSLSWTVVLITIVLLIHFRSVKTALVSVLPNALPVAVPLAMMGLLNIHLNVSTSMVSCLAIGLAVDNAIHFLARFRRESRSGKSMQEAVHSAVCHSGPAIVFVTIIIAGGFTIYLASSFAPNRYFGMLVAVAMVSAAVADLLILPYLIRVFRLK